MKYAMLGTALLLLAACETDPKLTSMHHPEPVDATECKGAGAGSNRDDCTILVDVQQVGDGCTVKVLRSQMEVLFAPGVRDKWILWQIDSNPGGYRFTTQGIAFKNDTGGNFKHGRRVANGQVFRWKNGGTPGSYDYGVQVQNAKTGVGCIQDPIIKNEV